MLHTTLTRSWWLLLSLRSTPGLLLGVSGQPPDKLIIVSRHGVRRQFPSSAFKFEEYAPGRIFAVSDEDWGAGKPGFGELTLHGFEAVRRVGEAAQLRYSGSSASLDLCNAAIYAEEGMLRDIKTAEAFFTGVDCDEFNGATLAPKDTDRIEDSSLVSSKKSAVSKTKNSWRAESRKRPSLLHTDSEYVIDQGSVPRGSHGECHMLGPEATAGRVGGDLAQRYAKLQPYKSLLDKLSSLLGCCSPALCSRDKSVGGAGLKSSNLQYGGMHVKNSTTVDATCGLADLGSRWDSRHWYTTFEGPLYAGKWFAEWLLLTYLNGMPFAWGELSDEDVVELGSLVTLYRSFEFDAGAAAEAFGSTLAAHLAATLDQWSANDMENMDSNRNETPEQNVLKQAPVLPLHATPLVGHGPEVDVVYYAAHDTNLLYLAELLDLKWLTEGGWQPNHTPPGGQLVFEVYGPTHPLNDAGNWAFAMFFDAQTPTQIRNLTQFHGYADEFEDSSAGATNNRAIRPAFPSRAPVFVPGCSQGAKLLCPVSDFANLVRHKARSECVTPDNLHAYLRHNLSLSKHPTARTDDLSHDTAVVTPCEALPGPFNTEASTGEDNQPEHSTEGMRLWSFLAVFSITLNLVLGVVTWRATHDRSMLYSPLNYGSSKDDDLAVDSALDISSHSDSASDDEVGASFSGLDVDGRKSV